MDKCGQGKDDVWRSLPTVWAAERGLVDLTSSIFFFLGLALLIIGAEALVNGAVRISRTLGVAPLVIGLTVVAFGTSAPELAVSTQASLSGQSGVSIGNVVGSNIFNVLLILGLSALITPLTVAVKLVRWDVPIMIGVSLLPLLLGLDGGLGRLDGVVLFAGIVLYTVFSIREGSREAREHADQRELKGPAPSARQWLRNIALVLCGLGLLLLGSRWLNDAAVSVARSLGISDLVIGLTLVAAGTSLPEVATSVLASIRGERDIAVGNVVGSNIFNVLAVLGASSLVAPDGIPLSAAVLRLDIPIMIAVAVACLPIFFTDHTIVRWEGLLFLAYYAAYTLYLFLDTTQHEALPLFSTVMLGFVIPLTVLTLILLSIRAVRMKHTTP